MAREKLGRGTAFRAWPKTQERLEFAERFGINRSELINRVLDKHLGTYLEREVEERRGKLREVLEAPLPK